MEQNQSERRFVRRVVLWSSVAALCIVALVLALRAYAPQLTLLRASSMISSGRPDDALALLDNLDASAVGENAVQSLRYQAALELDRQGRDDDALKLFAALADFANAKERTQSIEYARALRLEQDGQLEEAAQAYYLLGDYGDAATRYAQCMAILHPTPTPSPTPSATPAPTPTPSPTLTPVPTLEVTFAPMIITLTATPSADATSSPTPTPSPSPTPTPEVTPVPTTEAEGLRARRDAAPIGRVALGRDFTLGVCEDGSVRAVGNNDCGQCDVSAWTDVTQVATGAMHAVGLRRDGTVVATGDNTYGQCDVTEWRNVRQIAANDYDTFALTDAGTVLHCGYHTYDALSAWHDVQKLAAGSYGVIAVYGGGVLSSHPSMMLKGIVCDADVSRGYAIGLREDGTIIVEGLELPAWTHIVALSAGENAVLALDADGCVRAKFFRDSDAVSPAELPTNTDAIGVVAGSTHYAILFADGRVCCFGDNSYGQCDVSGWLLAK